MPQAMDSIQIEPIGYVESCFKERFGTPRQPGLAKDAWAIIRLRPELNFNSALTGLEGFSHLWILFWFHKNENKMVRPKVHPPRLGGEKIGLFATRSPHRPNPIGLSAVELVRIETNAVHVRGADIIDGTPVLDIKPYLSYADSIANARDGWTHSASSANLSIEWSAGALEQVQTFKGAQANEFMRLAEQMLGLDPRPTFYKGTVENPDPYTSTYGFRIEDYNLIFTMSEAGAKIDEVALVNSSC